MLRIPEEIVAAIAGQARAEAPNEACGYLAGREGEIHDRYPLTNVDASPTHFMLDPQEQFDAVKQAREAGLELPAVYHSHPETPARMSDEDIRLANDPNTIYVIYSLADDEIKAFRVDREKNVSEEGVEVVTGAGGAQV